MPLHAQEIAQQRDIALNGMLQQQELSLAALGEQRSVETEAYDVALTSAHSQIRKLDARLREAEVREILGQGLLILLNPCV